MRRALRWLCLMGLLLGAGWYAASLLRPDAPPDDAPGRLPSETAWIQRTFPHFQADPGAYRTAFAEAQKLRAAAKTDVFGAWELVGPTNVGGRVVDVEFDPLDPAIVYAAAATGGVFKSMDTGRTWQPIFDEQPILSIGDLAVDPLNPQIVYVGTGEANGGHNNFAGGGLYKSSDGGDTWRFLGLEETTSIGRIRLDPRNPQRVFLAAVGSYFLPNPERGLYRSDDGGESWRHVLFVNDSTGVIDFVMRPDNPDVLLAAAWQRVRRPSGARLSGEHSSLYKSSDGGETWTRLDTSNGLPAAEAGRIGLALCRDAPDVTYALYTDGFGYLGLYRSNDGGLTWFDADPDRDLSGGFGGFSWYFGQVRVHPEDPEQVYVMDVNFMHSTDGGQTWARQAGTHVDHHALAFHPTDPSFQINGNDGGLALSQNTGVSWTPVADLPVTQFYEIGLDPNNPGRYYGGTQDNGTLRGERLDDWTLINGGDGFYVIVDPTDPNVVYAESQHGGLVKIVGGQATRATNGIPSGDPRNWSTPVVMDPNNPQVLYYGTNRLYRTEDGTASWERISPELTKGLGLALIGTISTIAVAPTNSSLLYVGTDDGNVWVSEDYGATWRDATAAPLPFRWVTRLVVDPRDDRVAYATFSGLRWRDPVSHVFRTSDRGRTWRDLSEGLPDAPVNAFAVDPRNPAVLYLGSDIGAFVSLDAGASWQALGEDLPAVPVYDLKIYEDATQRFLVAGTHGRSMYRLDLAAVPTAVEAATPAPEALTLEAAYPNPFREAATLTYRLAAPANVRLEVFDALGRRVATLFDGRAAPGTHTAAWQDAYAAPGLYLARLTAKTTSGQTTRTTTLTRVR